MGIAEILVTLGTMLCCLLGTIVFGYAWYRFLTRNRWRGKKAMDELVEGLRARREQAATGRVRPTKEGAVIEVDHIELTLLMHYMPRNDGRIFGSGYVSTTLSVTRPRTPAPDFTILHYAEAGKPNTQTLVEDDPGLPEDWRLYCADPARLDEWWTPAVQAQAAAVRGWRLENRGPHLSARTSGTPNSLDELDGMVSLLVALVRTR